MSPRAAAVALALAASTARLPAQDAAASFDAVLETLEARKQKYHVNKRVAARVVIYTVEPLGGRYTSAPGADFDIEAVHDAAGNQRSTITATRSAARKAGVSSYAAPGWVYTVVPDGNRFYISEFRARAGAEQHYLLQATRGPAGLPLSFDGNLGVEALAALLREGSGATHAVALGPVVRTTKFGKEVVAVPSTLTPNVNAVANLGGGVVRQTSYFDPDNAYVFLGSESAEPATNARPWACRRTCVLEYEPRPDGPPVPRRFTRHVEPEGGEKVLEYEVEYTRFEDYTPTADDFRLEDRYGLTTPTGPADKALVGVRSAGAPQPWRWRTILAGVAVVGLAGVVGLVVYRRRAAVRRESPPGCHGSSG